MINFIDSNNNKVVSQWPEISRKAYYIHGTTSDRDRWNKYTTTIQQLNRIAFGIGLRKEETDKISYLGSQEFRKEYCDFSFQWGNKGWFTPGNNWFLNSVEDRRIASEKLIEHIKSNIGSYKEVVLIGHSHGGNVAIQAADKIFDRIPTVEQVFVLTIGTPAYNEEYITTNHINKNLTKFNKDISIYIPYLGKYNIPSSQLSYLETTLGLYFYVNCENPKNWKHNDKITHIALWNRKDYIDNFAWVLDRAYDTVNKLSYYPFIGIKPFSLNVIRKIHGYHAMTIDNSGSFTNPSTTNIEFDFNPQTSKEAYQISIKPIAEWVDKLDYLRACFTDLRLRGYSIPSMPKLRKYSEYNKYKNKENTFTGYVCEPDNLRIEKVNTTISSNLVSSKLRIYEKKLQELFIKEYDFIRFLYEIDKTPQKKDKQSPMDIIDVYQYKCPEMKAIQDIKQEMYNTTGYLDKVKAIYLLENTSFGEHGFDLANPKLIEEAINDGRIKPFIRAITDDTQL